PVGLDAGLRVSPALSDLLGPAKLNPQWSEINSALLDGHLNFDANIALPAVPLGSATASLLLTPYLGYRYLGAPTIELGAPRTTPGSSTLAGGSAISYSQFSGVQYGTRGVLALPLGFRATGDFGLTTLVSGGWDTRRYTAAQFVDGQPPSTNVTAAGRVDPGGATLPSLELSVSWSAGSFLSLSLGYGVWMLPTDLRTQGRKFNGSHTLVLDLLLGVSLGGLSL
ncbi:MAG TPA: hypothetical protein V6D47_08320, partial [Oscillatoriaceae cyanobacterium]